MIDNIRLSGTQTKIYTQTKPTTKKILITNYTKDIYSSRSTSWLNSYLNILCMASNKLFSNTGKKEGKLEKSIACASVLHRHGKDV